MVCGAVANVRSSSVVPLRPTAPMNTIVLTASAVRRMRSRQRRLGRVPFKIPSTKPANRVTACAVASSLSAPSRTGRGTESKLINSSIERAESTTPSAASFVV